ncbi:MAG: pilus assembly protein, partial [Lachnospiraceae bacterium]|nr:pilus assembly protein [Lachnospiraceae bacterium]
SYIRLSVEKTKSGGIADKRNQYGGKYYPCEGCLKKDVPPDTVWVTKTGTHYHASRDCGKIKRTVKKILFSEALAYRPCSRCAKGKYLEY